jgi:hypothetical protein
VILDSLHFCMVFTFSTEQYEFLGGRTVYYFNLRSVCDMPFSVGVVVHWALDNL